MRNPSLKQCSGVGIDVSKDTLSLYYCIPDGPGIAETMMNKKKDIVALAKRLQDFSGRVVMESTGRYHILCAYLLSHAGIDVRVINPLLAKKYTLASIRGNKTDKADARMLATMSVQEEHLPPPFSTRKEDIILKQKVGLLQSIERQLQKMRAMMENYTTGIIQLDAQPSPSEQRLGMMVKGLEEEKRALEKEIAQGAAVSQEKQALLQAIPGVSSWGAMLFLAFFSLEGIEDAKQWIAYAGLDIRQRQSGIWTGRGRLSKRGNPYFRKRIFSMGWGAAMNDERFKQWYSYLKQQGRSHKEATTILGRKIVRIAFSILKHNTVYNPSLPLFCQNA